MTTSPHIHNRESQEALRKLVLSAMFLAIGIVLPFFTGQIQQIGNMLLPMHLPVLMCGLVCGWQYGAGVGLVLPLVRSMMFGMPPLYPIAAAMSVELAVYGLVIGLIYGLFRRQNVGVVYVALIPAMILGRVAWGGAQVLLLGFQDMPFTWNAFITASFFNAIPGIVLQLILIPAIMSMLHLTGLVRFRGKGEET